MGAGVGGVGMGWGGRYWVFGIGTDTKEDIGYGEVSPHFFVFVFSSPPPVDIYYICALVGVLYLG